ncbi:hypothetical protein A3Q56_02965 [Intoshia linei]|uniref:Uncharacterized protein n=1 Tax=Intoshia linei TaxID=1819745 RepID=A0A177B6E4_9BILA|nr:hypothetical protein A3Q56_02965 [Intoshia linei]
MGECYDNIYIKSKKEYSPILWKKSINIVCTVNSYPESELKLLIDGYDIDDYNSVHSKNLIYLYDEYTNILNNGSIDVKCIKLNDAKFDIKHNVTCWAEQKISNAIESISKNIIHETKPIIVCDSIKLSPFSDISCLVKMYPTFRVVKLNVKFNTTSHNVELKHPIVLKNFFYPHPDFDVDINMV